jgi:hypothetical protein
MNYVMTALGSSRSVLFQRPSAKALDNRTSTLEMKIFYKDSCIGRYAFVSPSTFLQSILTAQKLKDACGGQHVT